MCVYYWIWIKNFAIITQPIYVLFKKEQIFMWKESQKKTMKILKTILTTASALKLIDYKERTRMIYCRINASGNEWGRTLMQQKYREKHRHAIHYESRIWLNVEWKYNAGKQEYWNILKMLKKCRDYLYEVYFILKLNANILVT